jgi:hypothetical protein
MVVLVLLPALATWAHAAPAERVQPLQAGDLEGIWKDFTQNDDAGTKKARQGIAAMIQAPQLAVPFLKERLKPVPRPDAKRIEQCLVDLDSGNFKTREKAMSELEALGELALPALDKKLADKTLSVEARRRMEALAQKPRTVLSGGELRNLRAVEVLEGIGTPDAKAVLDTLAHGGEGAVLTEQARRALARLERRAATR